MTDTLRAGKLQPWHLRRTAVVYVKGFATARVGEGRLVRALPLVSAVLVTALGLGLCYESLHPQPPPAAAAPAQP